MKIIKFGGTSVGSVRNIKKVAEIVKNQKGSKIVVLSAMSKTTNTLLKISDFIKDSEFKNATKKTQELLANYKDVAAELYSKDNFKNEAIIFIEKSFDLIKSYINKSTTNIISDVEKIIVSQGEILSTNLFSIYMKDINVESVLLNAFDFMRIDEVGEPNLNFITKKLKTTISENTNLYITQGYICLNKTEKIDNLKRGGSDYSASLIGAAIDAKEIQIWTDIDGIHNNDPRYVKNTLPLKEISFEEAAELAYFGAKILHPQSVIPAKEKNIPILLKNTFNPKHKGTIIRNCKIPNKVRAIAAKDKIIAIKIKSYRMLMAYGFLKTIFEIFEKYKTSIDIVTTSEVAVSLTIDDNTHLEKITKELENIGRIKVDTNLSIVCLVGYFSEKQKGASVKIFNSLANVPVRMISYGGSNYNVSLLINTKYKIKALRNLNKGVFKNNND